MFFKLLKYELRCMLRSFLPLWGGLLVVSGLERLLLHSSAMQSIAGGLPSALLLLVYWVGLVAVPIAAIVFLCRRFYMGLLRDEGYLMFTLPVKPYLLVLSKLAGALLLLAITGAAALASMALLLWTQDFSDSIMQYMKYLQWFGIDFQLEAIAGRLVLFAALTAITGAAATVLQAYLSLSLGQLFREHRVLFAIICFIAVNIVWSVLSGAVTSALNNTEFMDLLLYGTREVSELSSAEMVQNVLQRTMLWQSAVSLLKAVIFYVPTTLILSRKLNLE